MHWSTTPSKARCSRSDGVVRKRPNTLTARLSNGFGDVAARRALCRVFPARVASLPQQTGKTAVRGFVGKCAEGQEPRFEGVGGGSILVQDKAVTSPQVTPSRNAGWGLRKRGCLPILHSVSENIA